MNLLLVGLVAFLILFLFFGVPSSYLARPMRKLKPGTYMVQAIVYMNNEEVMLVVSWIPWDAEMQQRTYRLACLPNPYFCPRTPEVGDAIRVAGGVPNSYRVYWPD